ncbi:hypothetical protein LCGC14_2886230 [marine sediment metagenome]|uniref:Uncharacterized protein n=1 Tax=marine sediment metagenome TaxID=412755 RepID=A0A0F8XYU6_9ZZZZ
MAFGDDVKINETALMWECARQAMLFHKYADQLTDAQWERDKAKIDLDQAKAQVDKDIRDNPEKWGFGERKPTEVTIAQAVILSEQYQDANMAYIEAVRVMNKIGNAKDSMAQKKSMLESMVRLYLADWNAEPGMPAHGKEAVAQAGVKEHKAALPRQLGKAKDEKK